MQPISLHSRDHARCEACGEQRSFFESGDKSMLFGPRWLCARCYFGYVRHRARSSELFEQVSGEEVRAKISVITAGRYRRPKNETEMGRCVRLLALAELQHLAESETVKAVIADDLQLHPDALFPRTYDGAGGYDDRKDAIVADVRKTVDLQASDRRASLITMAICAALGAVIIFVLYRSWK